VCTAAEAASKVLTVYGIVEGIEQLFEAKELTEKLEKETVEAQAQTVKYQALVDNIRNLQAKRDPPPKYAYMRVGSTPGGLRCEMVETVTTWITKDKHIPQSEGAWDFRHLVLLNGKKGQWANDGDMSFVTASGPTGTKRFQLYAYGNLGTSQIFAIVLGNHMAAQPAGLIETVTSDGTTQKQMRELVQERVVEAKANSIRWKAALTAASGAIAITGGFLALVGILAADALIVAIGGLIVDVSGIFLLVSALGVAVAYAIYHLFAGSGDPIMDTIQEYYPSSTHG
jgi:hypothetical protein